MTKKELYLGTYKLTDFSIIDKWSSIEETSIAKGIDLAPSYGNSREVMKFLGITSHSNMRLSYKIDVRDMTIGKSAWLYEFLKLLELGKVDCMDVLFIHWPMESELNEAIDFLQWMKEENLTKNIGIANSRSLSKHHTDVLSNMVDVVQNEFHLLNPSSPSFGKARVLGYSPFANGSLLSSNLYQSLSKKYKCSNTLSKIYRHWLFDSLDGVVFGTSNERRLEWWLRDQPVSKEELDDFSSFINEIEEERTCFISSLSLPL